MDTHLAFPGRAQGWLRLAAIVMAGSRSTRDRQGGRPEGGSGSIPAGPHRALQCPELALRVIDGAPPNFRSRRTSRHSEANSDRGEFDPHRTTCRTGTKRRPYCYRSRNWRNLRCHPLHAASAVLQHVPHFPQPFEQEQRRSQGAGRLARRTGVRRPFPRPRPRPAARRRRRRALGARAHLTASASGSGVMIGQGRPDAKSGWRGSLSGAP